MKLKGKRKRKIKKEWKEKKKMGKKRKKLFPFISPSPPLIEEKEMERMRKKIPISLPYHFRLEGEKMKKNGKEGRRKEENEISLFNPLCLGKGGGKRGRKKEAAPALAASGVIM